MKRVLRPLLIGVTLFIFSIACSIGAGSSGDPLYTPPADGNSLTTTPFPTLTPKPTLQKVINSSTPTATPRPIPTHKPEDFPFMYTTQAGDTLPVLAIRFGVDVSEIKVTSDVQVSATGLLPPNLLLLIPNRLSNITSSTHLIPDSEVVFSPSAADFDVRAFVQEAGGRLSHYTEYLKTTGTTSGADIILRVAYENSINPRFLLALLEYQSGWVYGEPSNLMQSEYPMGLVDVERRGLWAQMVWAVNNISVGYYGWREGLLTEINFPDGVSARLAPDLNAGTVALQYYFAKVNDTQGWINSLDLNNGFPSKYESMYGNPWVRAQNVEPLYPPDLAQPALILPFLKNQTWSFSGGPHGAWEGEGAQAALDFAPAADETGCNTTTNAWVTAAAAGKVVRSGNGVVVLDLDNDGYEQTGWVLLYLHVSSQGRAPLGTWVERGDYIGKPSCEGGFATGPHVHIARKYNGEWIPADGPVPFDLGGWIAHAGSKPYLGSLTRDGETIYASMVGSIESNIRRQNSDP